MDSFEEWVQELQSTPALILVEGQNDKYALETMGAKNVLTVTKTPLYKTIEKIQDAKEVIILTDLDREGKAWYSKLRHHCQKYGIKVNSTFREFLFKETRLTHIEGLPHYLCKTAYIASKMVT